MAKNFNPKMIAEAMESPNEYAMDLLHAVKGPPDRRALATTKIIWAQETTEVLAQRLNRLAEVVPESFEKHLVMLANYAQQISDVLDKVACYE